MARDTGKAKKKQQVDRAKKARDEAKRKRELEAFIASDEGKQALERQAKEANEGHARDLAAKILEHAHRRVFERTLAVEVARWAHGPLDALMGLAKELRDRAIALSEREGVALRRTALEIEEVLGVVQGQLAHAAKQQETQEKEAAQDAAAVAGKIAVMRRACVLALANVFARVTVVDLGMGPWPFDVESESPAEAPPVVATEDVAPAPAEAQEVLQA